MNRLPIFVEKYAMKKSILIIFLSLSALAVQSQTTINNSNMPAAGNIIPLRTAAGVNGIAYTATGADFVWDFTTLTSNGNVQDTFLSVFSTPLTYNIAYSNPFDQAHLATVATKQSMAAIPLLQISDSYSFLKNSSAQFAEVGVGLTISGVGLPLTLNNPDIRYKFPITYGTVDSCDSKYGAAIPGVGYYGEKRHRVNYVDGWGTLYLPHDTFNVMRVKSIVDYVDTVYLDTLSFGFPISRTETEYKWLAQELNVPVLQITNILGVLTIRYHDQTPADFSVQSNENALTLNLYPNPASEMLTIDLPQKDAATRILIRDILGREVYRKDFIGVNKAVISLHDMAQGVYSVEAISGGHSYKAKLIRE